MREETPTALHLWEKVVSEDTKGKRLDCGSYLEVRLEDVFSRSSDQFTDSYFLPKGIKNRESQFAIAMKYTLCFCNGLFPAGQKPRSAASPRGTALVCVCQRSGSAVRGARGHPCASSAPGAASSTNASQLDPKS